MHRSRLLTLIVLIALVSWFAWGLYASLRQTRLNAQLITAVDKENALAVERLLAAGADPNTRENADPPHSWKMQITYTIKRRPLPAQLPGNPVLCIAACNGDLQIVRDLVSDGADVNATENSAVSPHGETALIESECSEKSNAEVERIQALVHAGIRVTCRMATGIRRSCMRCGFRFCRIFGESASYEPF
jgi:hypothetical protein